MKQHAYDIDSIRLLLQTHKEKYVFKITDFEKTFKNMNDNRSKVDSKNVQENKFEDIKHEVPPRINLPYIITQIALEEKW